MKFATTFKVLMLFQLSTPGISSSENPQDIPERQRKLNPASPCILSLKETQYIQHVQNVSEADLASLNISESVIELIPDEEEWYCELDEVDAQILGEKFVKVQGLDESFFEDNTIVSGEYTLMAPNAWVENGEMMVPSGGQGGQAEIEPLPRESGGRRLQSGTKTVLVVRIEAPDAATSANEQTLYNEVFEGNSLTKMYEDCSHGELNLIPYNGSGVRNGVTTVSISKSVTGVDNTVIRNAAVTALNNKLGGAAESKVDHVLMCIPPGTSGKWVAYAFVNTWLSVYNNDWCLKMSAQVHEVGHNLGLPHSGQGDDVYGDRSGMMGYSYGMNDAPQMCFNPSKSWRLGWYSGQRGIFKGNKDFATYSMVGVVDYDGSDNSKRVVVKILSGNPTNFFIGYNRAKGFNGGTRDAQNQVVIVEAEDSYKTSYLVGKLSLGNEKRIIQNYQNTGKDLIVKYRKNGAQGEDEAIVDVFLR